MILYFAFFIGIPHDFIATFMSPSIQSSQNQNAQPINIPSSVSQQSLKENLSTLYNRGNAYLMTGQFTEALLEFNKAAVLSPKTSDIYLSRGIVNEKLFRWDDAISDYITANNLIKNRAFSFSGDDATCISNLANAETGLGRWEEALKDYTYAASLKFDFVAPQLGRALVLYQLNNKNESIEYFKSLASKYPLFSDAQAALAVMLYERGTDSDIADALERWETAVEGDSRYTDVEWVRDIRRWPPRLVQSLETFKVFISAQ